MFIVTEYAALTVCSGDIKKEKKKVLKMKKKKKALKMTS